MANIPGQSDVATYQPLEIRAIPREDDLILPVTLAATAVEIPIGTVLGRVTTTGLYRPYSNTADDGTEVARVILAETVPVSAVAQNAAAFASAVLYKDMLVGLDDAAITDLGAREPVPNVLII